VLRSPYRAQGTFPPELVGVGSHFKRKMVAGLSGKSGWTAQHKAEVVKLLIAHEHQELYAQVGFLLQVWWTLLDACRSFCRLLRTLL
jgi:hypothetical protein